MKRLLLSILIPFLLNCGITAQPLFEKIFESSYSDLSINLRIENSGIFGLESFKIEKDKILFLKENKNVVQVIPRNKNPNAIRKISVVQNIPYSKYFKSAKFARVFNKTGGELKYREGEYSNKNFSILIERKTPSELLILKKQNKALLKYYLKFPNNLAYASLIGIDFNNFYFIEVQIYDAENPLKIRREVWVLDNMQHVINKIVVPTIKYASVEKEFDIDKEGNIYQLLTYPDKLVIIELKGLEKAYPQKIEYPEQYRKNLHYNNFVTENEFESQSIPIQKNNVSTTRAEILKRAEEYVMHKYYCNSSNLAPNGATAKDGDVVKTPAWLRLGWDARIPYKWGGFNTIHGFDTYLKKGFYAGDIDTKGVSSYAVGVDCSGFVSRCWNLYYHSSTRDMPNITTPYKSWDALKPGDAIHKIGHVRLFVRRNIDGSLKIVEASARNWDVSYWSYTPADLQNYTPRYLNSLTKSYFEKSVKLQSVLFFNKDSAKLTWQCDTTGVIGYRIYSSYDGNKWQLCYGENIVNKDSFVVDLLNPVEFFRVSAIGVVNGDTAESFWSNPMGINSKGIGNILIVNGFNRNYGSGSWQGEGNPFTVNYGLAFTRCNLKFESVKNFLIEHNKINLNNYNAVFWYLGDESTKDETFSSVEQKKVKEYLENGGKLFVSGSEVGWDLGRPNKSSVSDIYFYNNYLKAKYLEDDARSTNAKGVIGGPFDGFDFNFGMTFTEDYPDVIRNYKGSSLILKYSNGKGAGIYYKGTFGSSTKTGGIVYFGFPLESVADDSIFNAIVKKITELFGFAQTGVVQSLQPEYFRVFAPFPNPFNPTTNLKFYLPSYSRVRIEIFNLLGQKVAEVFNGRLTKGYHNVKFNAGNLASGVYFSVIKTSSHFKINKLLLLK